MTMVTWFETNRSGSGVKPPACAWRDAPEALAGPDALLYKGFHPMAPESRMTPRSPEETELLRTALRRFPGGVMSGYYAPEDLQFVIKEARGAHLYDFSGRASSAIFSITRSAIFCQVSLVFGSTRRSSTLKGGPITMSTRFPMRGITDPMGSS